MLKIIKNSDESIEMEDASDLNENILLCDFNNSISTKTTNNHNNDLNYLKKSKKWSANLDLCSSYWVTYSKNKFIKEFFKIKLDLIRI